MSEDSPASPPPIPCVTPATLHLFIQPVLGVPTARGRCGHPIAEEHALIVTVDGDEGGSCAIFDRAATHERDRDANGRRPLGFLGRHFGRSIWNCDACRRGWSLRRTIVCPCCGVSIPEMTEVAIVPKGAVQLNEHLGQFATTALDGSGIVVCEACAERAQLGLHPVEDDDSAISPWVQIWVDGKVMTIPHWVEAI